MNSIIDDLSKVNLFELDLAKGFEDFTMSVPVSYTHLKVTNPLEFPGYEEKLKKAEQKSDLDEGVLCGVGKMCIRDRN